MASNISIIEVRVQAATDLGPNHVIKSDPLVPGMAESIRSAATRHAERLKIHPNTSFLRGRGYQRGDRWTLLTVKQKTMGKFLGRSYCTPSSLLWYKLQSTVCHNHDRRSGGRRGRPYSFHRSWPFTSYLNRFRVSQSGLPCDGTVPHTVPHNLFCRRFRRELEPIHRDLTRGRTLPFKDPSFQALFNSVCEALVRALTAVNSAVLDRPSRILS